MLAVTLSELAVALHVIAVVVAFGGALTYPLWFRMLRDGTAEQRAFFHRAQAQLGKLVIVPGILVVFATGAYLASDFDVWSEGWVVLPTVILAVILVVGVAVLGPSEERLSHDIGRSDYDRIFRRVKLVTWTFIVLVVAATYMMVVHVPD